ncbi:MAG TPA: porin [Burkholderiaceae bacterium]|jgi:predicted porin
MKFSLTPIALAVAVLSAVPAHADDVSDLNAQIRLLNERLSHIETTQKEAAPATTSAGTAVTIAQAPNWNLIQGTDTTVSLYGKIDVTLASKTHADTKGNRQTGMFVSWMSGNRFGIHGSHVIDKESGTSVIATLENEFESPTGNLDTPNVLFNRDAWLGVQSETIGKLTFGRQNTLARDFIQTWGDAFGTSKVDLSEAGWCNNSNIQQMIFYGGGADGTRNDGSIVWKKEIGPWVVGATYAFGTVENGNGPSSAPGEFSNGSTTGAAIAYNGGTWNLDGTVTHAIVSKLNHDIVAFGGNYQFSPLIQWKAGIAHATVQQAVVGNRTDRAFSTSLIFTPAGKMRYVLGFHDINVKNGGYNAGGNTLGVTGDTSAVTTAADGTRRTYYTAAFYKFDAQTDVYVVADTVRTGQGYKLASTHGFNNMAELGTGIRWSF